MMKPISLLLVTVKLLSTYIRMIHTVSRISLHYTFNLSCPLCRNLEMTERVICHSLYDTKKERCTRAVMARQ